MADKIISTLKGRVKFETDKSSLASVRKEIKKLKDEMKGLGGPFGGGGGNSNNAPRTNRPQKNFEEYQKRTIKNFLISNKLIRSQTDSEKDRLQEILKQSKTREELKDLMIRERAILQDRVAKERSITKEKKNQALLQRRLTSSTEQMVGALGSAFVAAEAFRGIINTGINFEAFEKTFLAVSNGTEDAKNNMEFVRKEAQRMGIDVVESGKAFARMLGAGGTKVDKNTTKELFIAVSEASTAMGLSADDAAGSLRAVTQAMAKGKFMAEELRSQLGDRMPIALRAMENAAKSAGLDVENIGLDKLMEQGKLGLEVFPHFAKELRKLANNNNAFAKAAEDNFAPALARATNSLRSFSNEIFQGGLKDSLMLVLNNFADLTDSSKTLARTLGVVLGGAITGLVFPFKLLYAVLVDIASFFDVGEAGLSKLVPVFLGAAAGAILLGKALKMIVGMVAGVKALATAMKGLGNAATRTGKSAISTAKSSSKGAAKGTSKMMSFLPTMARTVLAPAALALAPSSVASGTPDLVQESGLSQDAALREFMQTFNQGNKIEVQLNMNENLGEIVEAKVTQGIQNEISEAYNTVGSSKD